MDVQEFEQAILKLAFETDARITTASVAYYLGIPSRQANELLNALLEEGVLELDSDPEGNLYYQVPHKPEGSDNLLPRLRAQQQSQMDAHPGAHQPARSPAAGGRAGRAGGLPDSVMLVSATDDDDSDPITPQRRGGAERVDPHDFAHLAGRRSSMHTQAPIDAHDDGRARPANSAWSRHDDRAHDDGGHAGGVDGKRRGGADGWNEPRPVRTRRRPSVDLFAGLTRRQARPDASLNRCGASPVIVSDAVRCDPRPMPSRKPVVASCVEPGARPSQAQWTQPQWASAQRPRSSEPLFDRAQSQSTMLAPTTGGDLAVRDDQIERPEHQPGMALLLSLILCGTGQIYNGEVSKGIMMMVLCFLLWFVLLGWVVHIWSIVDSVVVAERLNRKAG